MKKIQTYDIILYVILFVLFLALNKDKSHYNMLNSLGTMIFLFYYIVGDLPWKMDEMAYKIFSTYILKLLVI